MSSLLKYIVFLLLTFNICISDAAEVVFEPDEEDVQELKRPDFIEAGSLPHPVQIRQMLERDDYSTLHRLFILGQYFDARYPNDSLSVDFSKDVALIFPEMNEKEVQNTTAYIKTAIRLFRLSKEKIEQIKQEKLTPKDPPLVVSDDEYAILGDQEYVETIDGNVAIISDFKKVVGYGNNQREIEAMEAFVERMRSQNKKETDYEHFISMFNKLDWRALASYGVTRPSPFVGKAGIGSFEENEDIKTRLISDTARIGKQDEMIFGLHMEVPNHRFVLATNLNDQLQKPKIELVSGVNVADLEILEPMPLPLVSSELIGVYRGDFAFPMKVRLKEKNKPAYLKVQITLLSCDADFDCQKIVMTPDLMVDAKDEGKPVWSSMSNFIHQSLYNLPKAEHKDLKLVDVNYNLNMAEKILLLNFDFKYKGKVKNFAFFLENEKGTVFSSPEVIISQNHIYVQTEAVSDAADLIGKPVVLTARLNDFVAIRQTINLGKYEQKYFEYTLFYLFFLGVFCGVLFCLTPFGWIFAYLGFLLKNNTHILSRFVVSKAFFLCAFLSFFAYQTAQDFSLLYTLFCFNVFRLTICFFGLASFLFYLNISLYGKKVHPLALGAVVSAFVCALLLGCGVPYGQEVLSAFEGQSLNGRFVLLFGIVVGLIVPDLSAFYFKNKQINSKLCELLMSVAKFMICIALCLLGLRLLVPLTLKSIAGVLSLCVVGALVLKYVFAFWGALYKTNLKPSYISGTHKVLAVLVLGLIFSFAVLVEKSSIFKENQTTSFSLKEVLTRAQNGEKMIVALETPFCLTCKYNSLFVFNRKHVKKLEKDYQLLYLVQNIEKPNTVTIEFLKKYKRFFRPLYVLYTPLVPNGVVLPDLLDVSDLNEIFERFRIYSSSSVSEPKKSLITDLR